MLGANVSTALTPGPNSDQAPAPLAHHLLDEDRLQDEESFVDEKLPSDVKLVLWSFISVVLLACTVFAVSNRDLIQTRANMAPTDPTKLAIGTGTVSSPPPLGTAPSALTGMQAIGVTPSVENTTPLRLIPSPATATEVAPEPSPVAAAVPIVTPPETVVATAPAVYPSALILAPKQIAPLQSPHIHRVRRRAASDLCPIELANQIRPGCNTFASKDIAIR